MVSICWGPLVSDNEPDIHDDHYGLHSTLLLHGFACLLGAKLHQRRTHCWECNWQHWASYLQRQVRECGLFSGPYRNGNFITSPWTLQHLGFTPCYLFFALQCVILVWADCGLWRLLWADPRLSPLLLYAAPHKVDWPGEYLTRLTLHMTGWIFETRKFLWCDSSECVKRYQVKHDNFFYLQLICGMGVLLSVPLTLPAIGMAKDDVVRTFILIFIGQIFLNMNWAIIVDVSIVRWCISHVYVFYGVTWKLPSSKICLTHFHHSVKMITWLQ